MRNFIGMQREQTTIDFNSMAVRVHQANVDAGWWTDLVTGQQIDRNKGQLLMLVVTELAEAAEGYRKSGITSKMDDKLPLRRMEEVEMADAMIRCLDFAGAYKYSLRHISMFTFRKEDDHLQCLLLITDQVCRLHRWLPSPANAQDGMSDVISMIVHYCEVFELDLFGAYEEKLIYNKTREDHKIENRKKDGGKTI